MLLHQKTLWSSSLSAVAAAGRTIVITVTHFSTTFLFSYKGSLFVFACLFLLVYFCLFVLLVCFVYTKICFAGYEKLSITTEEQSRFFCRIVLTDYTLIYCIFHYKISSHSFLLRLLRILLCFRHKSIFTRYFPFINEHIAYVFACAHA